MTQTKQQLEAKIDRLRKAFGRADAALDEAREKRNKAWLAYRNAMQERIKG